MGKETSPGVGDWDWDWNWGRKDGEGRMEKVINSRLKQCSYFLGFSKDRFLLLLLRG